MEDGVQYALCCGRGGGGGRRTGSSGMGALGGALGSNSGSTSGTASTLCKKYRCSPVGPSKSESLDRRSQASVLHLAPHGNPVTSRPRHRILPRPQMAFSSASLEKEAGMTGETALGGVRAGLVRRPILAADGDARPQQGAGPTAPAVPNAPPSKRPPTAAAGGQGKRRHPKLKFS